MLMRANGGYVCLMEKPELVRVFSTVVRPQDETYSLAKHTQQRQQYMQVMHYKKEAHGNVLNKLRLEPAISCV